MNKIFPKKGALELSINAIVILILAIAILGLGLAFINKSFGFFTSQFDVASDEVKRGLMDRLKEDKSQLILSRYEIDLKRGQEMTMYIGIRNSLPTDEPFDICTHRFNVYNTCGDNTICTSIGDGESTCDTNIIFETFKQLNIKSDEIKIVPLKIKILGTALKDTYEIPIRVTQVSAFPGWDNTEKVLINVK